MAQNSSMDAVDDARFASSAAASRVRSSAGQSHQSFPSSSGVLQMASKSAASLSHVSISGARATPGTRT